MNENDIQELVEEHGTGADYQQTVGPALQATSGSYGGDVIYRGGGENIEVSLTLNEIRKTCKMWETMLKFLGKHYPNTGIEVGTVNLFNDNAMSHFHENPKESKNKCHWIGSLVKLHKKKKIPLSQ